LVYDNNNNWNDMFTEADELLAVTPEDIQRVASKYFPENGRNVAIYRTKKKEGEADPLWDALDEQQMMIASQIKAQLDTATDAAELEQGLVRMAAQRGAAPPQFAPVFDWAEDYAKKRIEALNKAEGGQS
jgi:hypothetical protein